MNNDAAVEYPWTVDTAGVIDWLGVSPHFTAIRIPGAKELGLKTLGGLWQVFSFCSKVMRHTSRHVETVLDLLNFIHHPSSQAVVPRIEFARASRSWWNLLTGLYANTGYGTRVRNVANAVPNRVKFDAIYHEMWLRGLAEALDVFSSIPLILSLKYLSSCETLNYKNNKTLQKVPDMNAYVPNDLRALPWRNSEAINKLPIW